MSDRMKPISFDKLMGWILDEYDTNGSVFGIRKFYKAKPGKRYSLFGNDIETLFGPAAGPHTQLAENIISAYLTGSRFFELKTVQKLDGEDLPVSKPCIKADDEGYNVEWSTELRVGEAFDEYVKAWVILHILAIEFDLGDPNGFVFNMSVGYDLDGIMTEKINGFIEGLKDAGDTESFKNAIALAKEMLPRFKKVTVDDIEAIPHTICNSVTLSTLHGCPKEEIEKIASYLIQEKKLNTFIKCNPTLLGYECARGILNEMGYDYVSFSDYHFKDDLQYEDAVPMLRRLMTLAKDNHLSFGVKITNTFPVDITENELPGQEMYMSGRSLYPLSITLAAKLSKEFDGKLHISYSGGADVNNIARIVKSGIYPVTMATTVLKPGGYYRMLQIAGELEKLSELYDTIDVDALCKLAKGAVSDQNHIKDFKANPTRKITTPVPIVDCFMAPCEAGCPIHQDIGAYMEAVSDKDYEKALNIIMDKNPLPFTTGTICAHRCMSKCTRNYYDSSVHIRSTKLLAAQNAYEKVLGNITKSDKSKGKVAIVGGGPASIAAAYFLLKANMDVTIYTDKMRLGGTVSDVIPEFRIAASQVDKDISFILKMGATVQYGSRIEKLCQLDGYDYIILAIGASIRGRMDIEGENVINAIDFLERFKKEAIGNIGKKVVVIGGGNTAMDASRAAKRTKGVESVSIIYRRDKKNMPADSEELNLALLEDVKFCELLSPVSYENGMLKCVKMKLEGMDSTGRKKSVATDEYVMIEADTVIGATGEKVDIKFYESLGLKLDDSGYPTVDIMSMKSSAENIYIIGDARRGPKTVAEAIADALVCVGDITQNAIVNTYNASVGCKELYDKKGIIASLSNECDYDRCLNCKVLCENCVDVCPNRANVEIRIEGEQNQIVHVDRLCNECGNCATFCPYLGAPYKDKLTLFEDEKAMTESENNGFYFKNQLCKLRIDDMTFIIDIENDDYVSGVDPKVMKILTTVYDRYGYLWR